MGKGQKKLQVRDKKNTFVIKCCVQTNVLSDYPELILLPVQRSNLCRINLIVTITSSIKMSFQVETCSMIFPNLLKDFKRL